MLGGELNRHAGLPRARGSGEGEEAGICEQPSAEVELPLPSDEAGSKVGQGVCCRSEARGVCEVQAGVLVEDPFLEPTESWTWLDAQFFNELCSSFLEDSQGFGLSSAPVEGEHELLPEALAEWVEVDEIEQPLNEHVVVAEFEVGVDTEFEGDELDLAEPCSFGVNERLSSDVGEDRTSPQAQRLLEQGACSFGVASVEGGTTIGDELQEEGGIELIQADLEAVAGSVAGETFPVGTQGATEH